MRRFTDRAGGSWEVVAGRESWGAIFALFIPVNDPGPLRQTPLKASSYEEANVELGGLDDEALQALLDRSDPKAPG
jgi:hypothetical protein